jgi:hypothetical protein
MENSHFHFQRIILLLLIFALLRIQYVSAEGLDSIMPVRGLCIAAPQAAHVDEFVSFIENELASRHLNTLILRVDYNYQYESHAELRDSLALSRTDVKKIVNSCKKNQIRLIPQINLLGHQSWASVPNKLLKVYPDLDETPWVKFPEKYVWPNADNLYCKSYCPLHPKVHEIIFALIDELCDVFETDAFQAGMDEVFYLGESQCPRCSGRDKAELFANEVRLIHDHLALKKRNLWIWGDRLLDGKTTGMGEWEASYNNTYRAIDLIPKDVMICDWHYDHAEQSAIYFSMKGLKVVSCPYRIPQVGVQQVQDMMKFRNSSTIEMKERFQGIVQTVWSDAESFIDGFYGRNPEKPRRHDDEFSTTQAPWLCFRAVFDEIQSYATKPITDKKKGKK